MVRAFRHTANGEFENMPVSIIDRWVEVFRKNRCIYIDDIEKIKYQYPQEYEPLKEQAIKAWWLRR